MPNIKDIVWFKSQLGNKIIAATAGTPFTLDMVTAIACQETGYIWQVLRKKLNTVDEVLELCVGDTIDASGGRSAFPRTKAELLAKPRGAEMFAIARDALERMAQYITGYEGAVGNPDRFCHGFGIFQYDLQFFKEGDPDFFLNKDWARFDACMAKFLVEIRRALTKVPVHDPHALTDEEMAYVAIAYNKGSFDPGKGLKQGHKSDGKYYGENIAEFLRLSKSVPWPPLPAPADVEPTPAPAPVAGALDYKVIARSGLRLREGPGTEFPSPRLIPFGTVVHVLRKDADWALVDLEGDGRADGHMHATYLERV